MTPTTTQNWSAVQESSGPPRCVSFLLMTTATIPTTTATFATTTQTNMCSLELLDSGREVRVATQDLQPAIPEMGDRVGAL